MTRFSALDDSHRVYKYVVKTSYQNTVAIIFNRQKILAKNCVFCPYLTFEDKYWRYLMR